MKDKIKKVGLAGLGLGVTIKEKFNKLVTRGKKAEPKFKSTTKAAGAEAIKISKKSLELLEKELKKLESHAKKKKR